MARPLDRMWRVARRPEAALAGEDLAWHEEPAGEPAQGELLVRVEYAVLDPALWTALPAQAPGEVLAAAALGVVVESRDPAIRAGTAVSGLFGARTYARVPAAQVFVHDPAEGFTDRDYLGVLNHLGATAYLGVREVATPAPGETIVVTGAGGPIGSLAAQIAKLEGARVVGIAANAEQCAWLTGSVGLDEAIPAPPRPPAATPGAADRRAEELAPVLARLCPGGIHAIFDGAGGPVLDACLAHLAPRARVALYGSSPVLRASPGPAHFPAIAVRRARVQGFSFLDFPLQFEPALAALSEWRRAGKLAYRVDITDGLEHVTAGLRRLATDGETLVYRVHA